ncbi:hypothetical protein LEL_01089 [Akanthomyces lecanii RCEF 1005]|uniref:Uncharacterized protein n=1 Tax=Akanthomyces lecanii RCEF 1005 TaxID=1081108 RepID=A0A168KD65_CORDF|nr:hypothetical protein LEL_01089 [Akanthomyces lecanii RCEF 1005]
MRAIWEGDMKVAKDIIELYMLVDNIHTWAVRVFKPSVALHLNQWKDVFSQENGPAGSFHAQPYIERYREMVPRVNALWKEFNEMEFESNDFGNLISPVHFSLLLQQMVVSDHDKLLERMESLVESKIQNLCACKCSHGSAEKERSMHQIMPDAPTRNSQRAGQGTRSGTASDSDSSRSDADKLGTDTTETSQATSSPQDSSMSPSLNRPEALAVSASAVKTPTQSIASPTPSTRGLHSQSPSSCHSWDTAVENPEEEPDGDDAVAESQRLDAQKEEASVTPCTSFILLSASGSSSSAAQEGSPDDSLTTCKTSGRAALAGGAPPKVVAGDFAYRPKAMPRRRLGHPGGKPLATLFGADATARAALTGKWLSDKFLFGDAGSRTPAKVDFTVSSKRWPPGTFFPDIVVKDAAGDEGGGSDEGATAGEVDSNKRPTAGEASSSK